MAQVCSKNDVTMINRINFLNKKPDNFLCASDLNKAKAFRRRAHIAAQLVLRLFVVLHYPNYLYCPQDQDRLFSFVYHPLKQHFSKSSGSGASQFFLGSTGLTGKPLPTDILVSASSIGATIDESSGSGLLIV